MPGGTARPLVLVDGDGWDADRRIAPDDDEREVALDVGDGVENATDGRHDDDALHAGRSEAFERCTHVVARSVERGKGQEMAGLTSRVVDPEQHLRGTELVCFDRHDSDRPRPTPGQHRAAVSAW